MKTNFDAYAAYYDLLYTDKDYVGEANFVISLLRKNQAASINNILELGCGTGKHASLLANMGYKILGVDLSPAMVKSAQRHYGIDNLDRLEFVEGDARTFRVDKEFDAVISLFHVVSYQTSNSDLQALLDTVTCHLKSGGLFIFDCWYGPAVLKQNPEIRIKRMSNGDYDVMRIAEPVMRENENIVDVNYSVRVSGKKHDNQEDFSEKHTMRYLFSPEIEMFLDAADMDLVFSSEWMSSKILSADTWSGVFVAKRRA